MLLKRELKVNLKSFLIWTSILLLLFLVIFSVYPMIIASENVRLINEMLKIFPEEMLKAFNMDLSSIDTAFGFLKTEGFIFVLLITGVYAAILGSNILSKEENDKTIEYLSSLPIKRSTIVLKKIVCAIFYIILMVLCVGIFNYIGLELSGDFNRKQYLLLSITPILSALPIFAICLFLSSFTHKTKNSIGLSIGIVFISYFLQVLSEMNEVTEFFKYFSLYTLANVRNVIVNTTIDPAMIILSIILTSIFIGLTIFTYEKKELV